MSGAKANSAGPVVNSRGTTHSVAVVLGGVSLPMREPAVSTYQRLPSESVCSALGVVPAPSVIGVAVPAVLISDKDEPAATYMPPAGPADRSVTLPPSDTIGVIVPGEQLVPAFEARPSWPWSATQTTPSDATATAVG